jgi:two-component system, chemotaxis family, response regulator Rcp1
MAIFRAIEILLVEDNPGDVRLTQEALKENKIRNNLHVAKDGVEAMNFLRKINGFKDAPRPDLVLLDLNLPKKDGREVLTEIKTDDKLRSIPVVILTTSDAEDDVAKAYQHYANCYIRKPIDLNRFIEVVKIIENFWLSIVELPPNNNGG